MIPFLWSILGGTSGLLLLIAFSILNVYESAPTIGTATLWFILGPMSAVGGMVHQRRISERYRYTDALKTGALTALLSAASLLIVWIIYIVIIESDFFPLMIASVERAAVAAGDTPAAVTSRVNAAKIIHSSPAFYVVSTIIPLVSGLIASVVAAIGVRKK